MVRSYGLDAEFMQYWQNLSLSQKQALLNLARNYVGSQERPESNIVDLRKELIKEEREKYLRAEGQAFSWEQVNSMAINRDQRHAL
jgi:hypothetical protein